MKNEHNSDPLHPAETASENSAWSKTTSPPPPLSDTESWAVATGLSKTGNFMFPLLLLALVLNAQLLRTCTHTNLTPDCYKIKSTFEDLSCSR